MNHNTPDNGDFAAYLGNLERQNKMGSPPSSVQDLVIEDSTDKEKQQIQELAELPSLSDDELMAQALASEGYGNEYDLDDSIENDIDAKLESTDGQETGEVHLAFLGEHALALADQATLEELNDIAPITDEELAQQALAADSDEPEANDTDDVDKDTASA
ncbi:hypothetical protein ACO0LG_01865 [Undibacterium sp. Ji42W]|uniref:hypothetical protein n=1 Tax=Undibacterium sp. Ji42W TaxID=3413039 RepID=UPI003BF31E0D